MNIWIVFFIKQTFFPSSSSLHVCVCFCFVDWKRSVSSHLFCGSILKMLKLLKKIKCYLSPICFKCLLLCVITQQNWDFTIYVFLITFTDPISSRVGLILFHIVLTHGPTGLGRFAARDESHVTNTVCHDDDGSSPEEDKPRDVSLKSFFHLQVMMFHPELLLEFSSAD